MDPTAVGLGEPQNCSRARKSTVQDTHSCNFLGASKLKLVSGFKRGPTEALEGTCWVDN